jgi:hypothetical protein
MNLLGGASRQDDAQAGSSTYTGGIEMSSAERAGGDPGARGGTYEVRLLFRAGACYTPASDIFSSGGAIRWARRRSGVR